MHLIGKLHPLLLHFPIGLVLAAATAELLAILTGREFWRAVGIANVRMGAGMAFLTAIAAWVLTSAPFIEPSRLLRWHAWMSVGGAAAATAVAALSRHLRAQSTARLLAYRAALFGAGREVRHRRGQIQLPHEPGLDGVLIGRGDVREVVQLERARVGVEDLRRDGLVGNLDQTRWASRRWSQRTSTAINSVAPGMMCWWCGSTLPSGK
jgi:hypothetical protein